jgi:pimeloyl-ACP methyl ester carboxylesterase
VFALDRPGCGLSTKVDYRSVDLRRHAVDVLASTLDGLGLERIDLVGSSMGGYWSLVFALAHPERVRKLVLVGEPAGSAPRPPIPHWLLSTPIVNRVLYATKLKPSPATVRESFRRWLVADVRRVSNRQMEVAYAAAVLPGAQQSWLTILERGISAGGASRMTYPLRPELSHLRTPSLFVWGEQDRFGPPRLGWEMARRMPDARVEVVADAGHLVWLDQPDRTTELILSFLSGPG